MATRSTGVYYDEGATCWHLMVTTYGGAVSMLQNLDAETARQAYRNMRPSERPREYIKTEGLSGWSTGSGSYGQSDIRYVTILGPEGAVLEPWRGVEPWIIDMAPERARQEAYAIKARQRRARADEMAAKLNVIPDLRPEISDSGFRCACCSKRQPEGSLLYYVSDGLTRKDPPEAFRKRSGLGSFHSSGWCAACVPKTEMTVLGAVKSEPITPPAPAKPTVPDTNVTDWTPLWAFIGAILIIIAVMAAT